MQCPKCQGDTSVQATRNANPNVPGKSKNDTQKKAAMKLKTLVRCRLCFNCNYRFFTQEKIVDIYALIHPKTETSAGIKAKDMIDKRRRATPKLSELSESQRNIMGHTRLESLS